jgi:hypothetical protein
MGILLKACEWEFVDAQKSFFEKKSYRQAEV